MYPLAKCCYPFQPYSIRFQRCGNFHVTVLSKCECRIFISTTTKLFIIILTVVNNLNKYNNCTPP